MRKSNATIDEALGGSSAWASSKMPLSKPPPSTTPSSSVHDRSAGTSDDKRPRDNVAVVEVFDSHSDPELKRPESEGSTH